MVNFNLKDSKNSVTFHIIIFAVIIAFIYFFRLLGDNMAVFGSVVTTIAGLISVVVGIFALKHLGFKTLHGKSVFVITIANFLWTVADLTWFTVNKLAVVSFSDILWLVAYPLFFFGILFGIQAFIGNIFKSKRRIIVAAVFILVFGALYFNFFPLSWDPAISDVENMVSVGYVLGDLFLLLPLILLVCISFGEMFSFSWTLIGLSLIFTLADDMLYTFNPEGYVSGSIADLVRFTAYLLYAFAFLYLRNSAEAVSNSPVQKMPEVPINSISVSVPLEKKVRKTRKSRKKVTKR